MTPQPPSTSAGIDRDGLHLLVDITFLYRSARLPLLRDVARSLLQFPVAAIDLVIVTDTADIEERRRIAAVIDPLAAACASPGCRISTTVQTHADLADPWHLTWCHKRLIADRFLADPGYTHFIHLEDDILFSWSNFRYFLEQRGFLAGYGLLPGFLRVEYNTDDGELYLVDQVERDEWQATSRIEAGAFAFVTPFFPYCAMYILDRAMAAAHRASPAFDREDSVRAAPHWGMPERSTLGLCYDDVPPGFHSRHAVPVRVDNLIPDPQCWIFHISNNYCRDGRTRLGKVRPCMLFDAGPPAPLVVVNASPPALLRAGGCVDSVQLAARTLVTGWVMLQADAAPRTFGVITNLPVAHATLALRESPNVVAHFGDERLRRAGFMLRLDLEDGGVLPERVDLRIWTQDPVFGGRAPIMEHLRRASPA